ncbi:MAG: Stk1 family PASTA domain-containing Ser/Thr kinase [Clostridia bacterium]|nr:Stk1 family PASTA domain-containing Ser/Thr kinase [Clostridia bacterium]
MEKILANRYRLTEQIGMGGMAIVYKAVDMRTGHNVAVKVLRPEFNEDSEFIGRFQREAEAASKMTHHNIVNLLDVGMDGENRYLVMEYVQGKTLKEVIQERGKISPPLACQITIRILSALEHAHRNGIIHRDIKPHNILVHADGHIKVADFGIARIANSSTLTRGDNVMGSVHYFSPEQARGEGATAASDIYSTGVVLYEMLTGRVPFDGDNPVAVAMQHLHATPPPIQSLAPDVPPAVVNVCMKALEKNPANRYQSARDMAADLRLALDDRNARPNEEELDVHLPKPQIAGREENTANTTSRIRIRNTQKKKRRNLYLTIIISLAVLAIIGGVGRIIYHRIMTTATVPDVVGLDLSEADQILSREGLNNTPVYVNSEEYAAGQVFLQNPEADSVTRKGDMVLLTVSSGPAAVIMPDLQGAPYSEALSMLNGIGITQITIERIARNDFSPDTVVSQTPAAGETVSKEQTVLLSISGGEAVVPNLINLTLTEAESALQNSKLVLNTTLQYVDTEDASQHGLIAAQTPEADSRVILNTAVSLKIYRCTATSASTEIEVTVPESDKDITVRITLTAEDSNVELEAVSYICAADAYRTQNVKLNLPDGRKYWYTIYLDGVQNQRVEIN